MIINSPYSVEVLKKELELSSPTARQNAAFILGEIADKGRAESFGYVRDVSAGSTLLASLSKEKNPKVLSAMLISSGHFYDSFTKSEKDIYFHALKKALDSKTEYIRSLSSTRLLRYYGKKGASLVRSKVRKGEEFLSKTRLQKLESEIRNVGHRERHDASSN